MKQEPKIIDYPIIKFSMDVHRSTTYSWPEGKDGKGDKLFETDTSLKTFEFEEDIDLIDVFSTPINDEKPGTVQDRAAERELAVFKKRWVGGPVSNKRQDRFGSYLCAVVRGN